jgi:hypothetical protein
MMMGVHLPVIDCRKMKTSMLKFNTSGEMWETIVRANGLRNETFACPHCRHWFSELIADLRTETVNSLDQQVIDAWKSYKTDADLWSLYTGLKYSDVCVALASVMEFPEYKTALDQSDPKSFLSLSLSLSQKLRLQDGKDKGQEDQKGSQEGRQESHIQGCQENSEESC